MYVFIISHKCWHCLNLANLMYNINQKSSKPTDCGSQNNYSPLSPRLWTNVPARLPSAQTSNVDLLDFTVHQFSTVLNPVPCVVFLITWTPVYCANVFRRIFRRCRRGRWRMRSTSRSCCVASPPGSRPSTWHAAARTRTSQSLWVIANKPFSVALGLPHQLNISFWLKHYISNIALYQNNKAIQRCFGSSKVPLIDVSTLQRNLYGIHRERSINCRKTIQNHSKD